jgi:hypothetical protein
VLVVGCEWFVGVYREGHKYVDIKSAHDKYQAFSNWEIEIIGK